MNIREIRKTLGLTQAELGALLGVDGSVVSRMESGDVPVTPKTELALEALLARADRSTA